MVIQGATIKGDNKMTGLDEDKEFKNENTKKDTKTKKANKRTNKGVKKTTKKGVKKSRTRVGVSTKKSKRRVSSKIKESERVRRVRKEFKIPRTRRVLRWDRIIGVLIIALIVIALIIFVPRFVHKEKTSSVPEGFVELEKKIKIASVYQALGNNDFVVEKTEKMRLPKDKKTLFDGVSLLFVPEENTSKALIVAIVDETGITKEFLEKYYNFFFFVRGLPPILKQQITKEAMLNQSIDELLLVKEALKQGIIVNDSEVDKVMDRAVNLSKMSLENISDLFEKNGFSIQDLRDFYWKTLLVDKLLNKTVIPKVNVTEADIKDLYVKMNLTIPYKQVRDQLEKQVIAQKRMEVYRDYISGLRNKSQIVIFKEALS